MDFAVVGRGSYKIGTGAVESHRVKRVKLPDAPVWGKRGIAVGHEGAESACKLHAAAESATVDLQQVVMACGNDFFKSEVYAFGRHDRLDTE